MTIQKLDHFIGNITWLVEEYVCDMEEWEKIFEDFKKNGFQLIGKTVKCYVYYCKNFGCLVVSGECNIYYYKEDGIYKELVYFIK